MIEFINIDSGTSPVTEQFFLVCHSKVMKQCHGVIRIDTLLVDLNIGNYHLIHLIL